MTGRTSIDTLLKLPESDSEAIDWFIRLMDTPSEALDGDETRGQLVDEFLGWVSSSPDHLRSFLDIVEIYQGLGEEEAELSPDVLRLLADAGIRSDWLRVPENQIEPLAPPQNDPLPSRVSGRPWITRCRAIIPGVGRVAAGVGGVIAAAVGLVAILFALWPTRVATYSTAFDQGRPITLEDQSIVTLNSHSKIQIEFSWTGRRIRLVYGEALFQVAPERLRHFEVTSATAVIRALGTKFDVYQRDGSTRIAVVDGRVSVKAIQAQKISGEPPENQDHPPAATQRQSRGRSITLGANEVVDVTGADVVEESNPDIERLLAWRGGMADHEPLADIAAALNLHNDRKVIIVGEAIGRKSINGYLKEGRPESLVEFLKLDPELSVQDEPHGWIIRARQGPTKSRRDRETAGATTHR